MGVTFKKCHVIMSGNDCWNCHLILSQTDRQTDRLTDRQLGRTLMVIRYIYVRTACTLHGICELRPCRNFATIFCRKHCYWYGYQV